MKSHALVAVSRRLFLTACASTALCAASTAYAQDSTGNSDQSLEINAGTVEKTGTAETTHATVTQSVDVTQTQTRDVITAKQLSQIPVPTDFIQGLQYLPNIDVYEQGGNGLNGSSITINGFDNKGINFGLDGIPLNDSDSYSFYSNEFIQNIDIQSINVDPGAGSAKTVGLSAFGASVGVQSKDPDPTLGVTLNYGAGSFDTYTQYIKANSGLFLTSVAPTTAYLTFTHASSEGYFDNSQTSFKNSLMFKSLTQLGEGTLRLFYSQNHQQFYYYGGCTQADIDTYGDRCNRYNNDPTSTNYTGYQRNRYLNRLTYAEYARPIGRATLSNQLYYFDGNGFGGAAYYDKKAATLYPEKSWNITHRLGDTLKAEIPLLSYLTIEPGVWFQLNRTHHYEGEYDMDTGEEIPGARVYDEYVRTQTMQPYTNFKIVPIQSLTLNAGLKYLIVDRSFADYHNSANNRGARFREPLPSVGVNYEFIKGYNAYVNFSENARPPGYNQFYTGTFNQDLSIEKARTYQGGFYAKQDRLEGRLSGFYTLYDNYILALQVPDPRNPSGNYLNEVINAGKAKYYGGALAATYQFLPWLSGFANIGVLATHLETYDGPAANTPNQTQALGVEAKYKSFDGTIAAHRRGRRFASYLDAYGKSNTFSYYKLPSMTTLDASLAYTWLVPPGKNDYTARDLTVKLTLTNITDERSPTSAASNNYSLDNPYLYLNEPFSFFGTIAASF